MADQLNLASEVCTACQVGAPSVPESEAKVLLTALPGWVRLDEEEPKLYKKYRFSDFVSAQSFANQVGVLAESQTHHPRLVVEWGSVEVFWWTHKIRDLHRNDFVCAAKTDALLGQE